MARFGTWAPLASNWASQPRMSQVDIISLHTMVGSLAGTDAYFRRNGFGRTFSHFGIGGNGECTQWQDTAYRAAANYNGNWHIISVECADVGAPFPAWNTNDGSAVPAFSDAQIETLARLIATIAPAHNIPIALIPDAKPGRRGIGYHRQGVPGYMVAGAEQWSTATGKVCPGNRRIAQIPQIIARAQQIANGDTDDMSAEAERQIAAIHQALFYNSSTLGLNEGLGSIIKRMDDIPRRVWGVDPAKWSGSGIVLRPDDKGELQANPSIQELADINTRAMALIGQIAGLSEALRQLAAAPGQSVDLAGIEAAVAKALKENAVTVDVNVAGKGQ